MKIKVLCNELLDSSIEFVSLVKHGAVRSPFKILKAEEVRMRNERREQLLARRNPRGWIPPQPARKSALRAADVGCAAIFKDEFFEDENANRHGRDNLQANKPAERGFWENFSAMGDHFRQVIAMLRATGQSDAAQALEQAMSNIAAAGTVTKQEEALLFSIANRFRGGGLDWLEQQGQMMIDRNAALIADSRLSSLDESLHVSRNTNSGIEKTEKGDRVLDDAYDAGMGVQRRY